MHWRGVCVQSCDLTRNDETVLSRIMDSRYARFARPLFHSAGGRVERLRDLLTEINFRVRLLYNSVALVIISSKNSCFFLSPAFFLLETSSCSFQPPPLEINLGGTVRRQSQCLCRHNSRKHLSSETFRDWLARQSNRLLFAPSFLRGPPNRTLSTRGHLYQENGETGPLNE